MTEIEERLSFLIRAVDDLSDVVARQDVELKRLRAQISYLTRRDREEAHEREGEGGIVFGQERPPHY